MITNICCYRRFESKLELAIFWGGVNCTDDLRINWTWRFWGEGGKSYRQFEGKSDLAISAGG